MLSCFECRSRKQRLKPIAWTDLFTPDFSRLPESADMPSHNGRSTIRINQQHGIKPVYSRTQPTSIVLQHM